MAAITWSENYSVGVPTLDDDHKRLIEIINRVIDDFEHGRSSEWALGELEDYARHHFRREERMLEAANYEGLEDHKHEHLQFIEWLRSVERTAHLAPDAYSQLSQSVGDYLKDWLITHILATDMDYRPLLS